MLCPQNMSVGPRLPESMVWHVLKREKRNMLLLLRMMMDYDEGCWMMVMVMVMAMAMVKVMVLVMMVMVMVVVMMVMVMVMVMIVDIVFSIISWGRELRRSPWRALRHGLRRLWAVVVPMHLASRATRRPGPSEATQLRGSQAPRVVLVHGLQTKLRAQRRTACFVPVRGGGYGKELRRS